MHKPGSTYGGKLHAYIGAFFHIILVQFRLYPRTTKSKVYQVGRNCHWNNLLQRLDVAVKFAVLVVLLCLTELLTNIATQILVRHFNLSCGRVFKTETALDDFRLYFGFTLPELFRDVWNINAAILKDACYNAILDVTWCRLFLFLNNATFHHIGFTECLFNASFAVSNLLIILNRCYICIVHIVAEECNSSILVEMSVSRYKIVIRFVEFGKKRLQSIVVIVGDLVSENSRKGFLNCAVRFKALNLCMSLYLVGIDFKGLSSTDGIDI